MSMFDKAKDLAKQADELEEKADQVAELAREHGDKLPGGLGDKIADTAEKLGDLAERIPDQD